MSLIRAVMLSALALAMAGCASSSAPTPQHAPAATADPVDACTRDASDTFMRIWVMTQAGDDAESQKLFQSSMEAWGGIDTARFQALKTALYFTEDLAKGKATMEQITAVIRKTCYENR